MNIPRKVNLRHTIDRPNQIDFQSRQLWLRWFLLSNCERDLFRNTCVGVDNADAPLLSVYLFENLG